MQEWLDKVAVQLIGVAIFLLVKEGDPKLTDLAALIVLAAVKPEYKLIIRIR